MNKPIVKKIISQKYIGHCENASIIENICIDIHGKKWRFLRELVYEFIDNRYICHSGQEYCFEEIK